MRCNEFERRLQRLLDDRHVPDRDEELRRHAAVCSHCDAVLSAQQLLFDALAMSDVPAPDAGFTERVVAQVHAARPDVRRRRWPMVVAALAVAASLMLVLLSPVSNPERHSATDSGTNQLSSSTEKSNSVPVVARARNTTGAAPSTWWILPPDALQELYPEDARQRHLRQVDRLANDLRPLTRSFSAAARALRRTLPRNRNRGPKGRPQASLLPSGWLGGWS